MRAGEVVGTAIRVVRNIDEGLLALHCADEKGQRTRRPRRGIHALATALFVGVALATVSSAQNAAVSLAPRTWISSGPLVWPLADAQHRIISVKDPTVVYHDGNWHVFATTADQSGTWSMAYFKFGSWEEAPRTRPFYLGDNPHFAGYNCAPQVFYFRPQKKWYLIFQSPQPRFSTTDNLVDPNSWTAPQNFFAGTPKSVVEGWLDYWIICDDTHAYLFFPDDNGRFYRSRTRLEDFPHGFSEPVVVLQEKNRSDLFEGSCVYRLKGTNQYLALVECMSHADGSRYYRAFTADRLDGEWQPLADGSSETTPFAGNANVIDDAAHPFWSNGISHGELLRESADETMTVDPQNLRLLYQGLPRDSHEKTYALLPYRLALLQPALPTATNSRAGN